MTGADDIIVEPSASRKRRGGAALGGFPPARRPGLILSRKERNVPTCSPPGRNGPDLPDPRYPRK